jgi:hypothetical protein
MAGFSLKDENVDPNKDFVLYFRSEDIHEPKMILEKHPSLKGQYAAMLTFFPDFNKITMEEVFKRLRSH